MANIRKGHLKIRGNCKNIVNFLSNEFIDVCGNLETINTREFKMISSNFFVMKNNQSHGVGYSQIHFYTDDYEDSKEDIIYVLEDFFAFNKIDVKFLKALSKQYNLDFKIKGFEQYQEFVQKIHIERGKVIQNNLRYVKNYEWNVFSPMLDNFGY